MASGLSGIFFPYLTGVLVDRFSYLPVFFMAAVMPLIGVVTLLATVDRYRPVTVTQPAGAVDRRPPS